MSCVPSMGIDRRIDKRFRFEFEVGGEHTARELERDDISITELFVRVVRVVPAGYRALF